MMSERRSRCVMLRTYGKEGVTSTIWDLVLQERMCRFVLTTDEGHAGVSEARVQRVVHVSAESAQCSAPLSVVEAFHGVGALRLVGGLVVQRGADS
jgi:hypothetical protein